MTKSNKTIKVATPKKAAAKRTVAQAKRTTAKKIATPKKAAIAKTPATNSNIAKLVSSVNITDVESHTRRSLVMLLRAGSWMTMSSIRGKAKNARPRDLRKDSFGGFKVECSRSVPGMSGTCYRINPETVTKAQMKRLSF